MLHLTDIYHRRELRCPSNILQVMNVGLNGENLTEREKVAKAESTQLSMALSRLMCGYLA